MKRRACMGCGRYMSPAETMRGEMSVRKMEEECV